MLHLGILGAGKIIGLHAKPLAALTDVKVTALCDPVAANVAGWQKTFPDARGYGSTDELFASHHDLHAVIIASPHTLHHAHAAAALDAGCHVLLEKPMVTRSADAYDLWRRAEASGLKLGVAYQSVYSPEYRYLAAERDAGNLGKFQIVSGWLSQGWMNGTRGTWRQDPSLSGGGQMYDSGAHLLNAIMYLVNRPVVEVACLHDTCGAPVDINGVAIFRFDDGTLASVAIGGNCPADFAHDVTLQTDRYRITTTPYGRRLDIFGPKGEKRPVTLPTSTDPTYDTPVGNFVRAIRGEDTLRGPARLGVLLSTLMDAIYASAEQKRTVRVEPVPDTLPSA